ncbi:hypothetical protein LINPERPRIM_LOCUS6892, partial [Linum perenne]
SSNYVNPATVLKEQNRAHYLIDSILLSDLQSPHHVWKGTRI